MDMTILKKIAKEKFGNVCRVCSICDGKACKGEVPGAGGVGSGRAFQNNLLALQNIKLRQKIVHDVTSPITECSILGYDLSMPIIGAPITGIPFNWNNFTSEKEYTESIVYGCKNVGTLGMTGDTKDPAIYQCTLDVLGAADGWGIPTIKPRPNELIIELALQAIQKAHVKAIAIDVDAAALINMTASGQPVSAKTISDLKELKANIPVPIIIKGVMEVSDAEMCLEAGIDAIVVSNHGGRVLDDTPGAADVLEGIANSVKGRMTILVDGGIRSGTDVLKLLALGADAVLLGRPLTFGTAGGTAGVEFMLNKFRAELIASMTMTGTADVKDVSKEIIWRP